MANEQTFEKTNSPAKKPAPDPRTPAPRPQVPSPLLNDGPELVRDSHC
jgi:hypothetical protein